MGRSQRRYNRPVEVLILILNDIILVGRAMFCSILKLSFDLIRRYIVLYFLPKKSILLPTNDKITGIIGSQNGPNVHSLQDPCQRSICIHRWSILITFIISWNPRFNLIKENYSITDKLRFGISACDITGSFPRPLTR